MQGLHALLHRSVLATAFSFARRDKVKGIHTADNAMHIRCSSTSIVYVLYMISC